jgi:hydrogenase/urease accessory protein HupE
MLSAPAPSLLSTMQRYLVTGVEHIFMGYDHIAFLVGVVLWARRLVPVIKIVTAFTIAHSITLSLAALDVIVIPSAIVEPAIAASIVFVAVENFFSRDIDRRWRVTFAFGLVHGFGFASTLREIGYTLLQPLQKPALEESVTQAETSDTVPRIDSLNSLHKSGNI